LLLACWMCLVCGGSPRAAEGRVQLGLSVPALSVTLAWDGRQVIGAGHQLTREGDELRGQAWGQPVDLSLREGRVSGLVGTLPARLSVSAEENGTLKIGGTWAGQLSRLEVGPEELEGRVGLCSYELRADGEGYRGQRRCAGRWLEPTTVSLPAALEAYPPEERAALLALLLAR
jgi:hypothetical protein